jgi:hypothetical protein
MLLAHKLFFRRIVGSTVRLGGAYASARVFYFPGGTAMEKLKLALEDLVVESFTPAELPDGPGTVHAQEAPTYDPACPSITCLNGYTCWNGYTCGDVGTCRYPECTKPGALC